MKKIDKIKLKRPTYPNFFGDVTGSTHIFWPNNDMLESLDEFEILPDLTTDHRFSCPLGSNKSMVLLFLVCYLSDPF